MTAAAPHTPALAAGDGGDGAGRALLLSGGGMRVAYQAGVLVALERAGLRFTHFDGSSGGSMNLSMLLSGLTPAEICERWRTLTVLAFGTPQPLRRLLRGPPYPALGSSVGIRRWVYPHLGIDVDRIRAARGMTATYNIGDYERKLCLAVPHAEVDLDLLVAGMSLPIFSPAVRRAGRVFVDAAWIKDVNVADTVARGAEELWLVWSIGNHGVYFDGILNQYVHMLEMAANGALFGELAAVREGNATRERPIRLHVIRPRVPLPLDPDFFFGRIDAATLVAMGHRDACEYLASRRPDGVELGPGATRMDDPRPGVGFRETLAGGPLRVRLGWEVEDLEAFADDGAGRLVGEVSHPTIGEHVLATGSDFVREGERWRAELRLPDGRVELVRHQRAWRSVAARLLDAGGAEVASGQLTATGTPAWATLHARGVGSAAAGARAVTRFGRLVLATRSRAAGTPFASGEPPR